MGSEADPFLEYTVISAKGSDRRIPVEFRGMMATMHQVDACVEVGSHLLSVLINILDQTKRWYF